MEDLLKSANQNFSNNSITTFIKSHMEKRSIQSTSEPWILTEESEKFIDLVSDSTLQLTHTPWGSLLAVEVKKSVHNDLRRLQNTPPFSTYINCGRVCFLHIL